MTTAAVQLEVVEIVVDDMARSLAFYRLLGLEAPEGSETEPHVELTLAGGLRLAFDTVETIRSFDPDWTPPAGGHRLALAFRCTDAATVDATHDDLVAAGGGSHLAPWDAFWSMRYAVVTDPDGTHLDLMADLPAAP